MTKSRLSLLVIACLLRMLFPVDSPALAQDESRSQKLRTYPDLGGTLWTGIDFQGKKYRFTFHTGQEHRQILWENVAGGTFSVVTDPPQKLVGGDYGFTGSPDATDHGNIPTYQIEFYWPGAGLPENRLGAFQMKGTLVEARQARINMEYVEPTVVGIDFSSLFGKADKGLQRDGEDLDCLGHDISVVIMPNTDAVHAREGLEDEIGPTESEPGPYGLGEVCYSQGPRFVCFVRDNLFIMGDRHTSPLPPDVEKQFMKILYTLDLAIRDEDPSVSILRMPKSLVRTQ